MTDSTDLTVKEDDVDWGSIEAYVPMKKQHMDFLKSYQKDLDLDKAIENSGLAKSTVLGKSNIAKAIQTQMAEIEKAHVAALQLNTASAAAKHVELMQKMEKVFDEGDVETKIKMASPLTRMSDTSLKATNNYDYGKGKATEGVKVEINIDLGSNAGEPKDITAEIIDGDN